MVSMVPMMEEVTNARRWMDVPVVLDRGRFWGLAFARSGERIAYVTHDLGFCQTPGYAERTL